MADDGDSGTEERRFDVVFHHARRVVFHGDGIQSGLAQAYTLYSIDPMDASNGIEIGVP